MLDADMAHALLIGTASARSGYLARVSEAVAGAGAHLVVVEDVDEGLAEVRRTVDAGTAPHVVLFGPDLDAWLPTARAIHQAVTQTHFIVLTHPGQETQVQRDISPAAMIGDCWNVVPVDSPRLAKMLHDAVRASLQRRHIRTTLDRMNMHISSQAPVAPSEYRKLVVSERYLHSILTSAHAAIVTASTSGVVLTWNQGAEQLFTIDECSAVGRHLSTVAAGGWKEIIPDLVRDVLNSRTPMMCEVEAIRADDGMLYVEVSLAPVIDAEHKLIGMTVIARDVTERKRAQDAIQRTKEELERSNLELQQYASVISHDLQAPLRSVHGFVQLLWDEYKDTLDDRAKELIAYAIDGASHMTALVQDLLEYSRVESCAVPFKPVAFSEVFDTAVSMLGDAIRETGATVTRDALPTVTGDKLLLVQLLTNLIGNGVKYRDGRTPEVHVSAREADGEWVFAVRDNGIGIEAEYQDQIFDIFRRLHGQRSYPGTGIGLAVCRRVIERHGGRIWVNSEPNNGATFYFTLSGAGGPAALAKRP